MPKAATKTQSTKTEKAQANKAQTPAPLNSYVQNEIARLAEIQGVSTSVLEEFARFVIENHKKKEPSLKPSTKSSKAPAKSSAKAPDKVPDKVPDKATAQPAKSKPLTAAQIKAAIYQHFSVENTTELKKSGAFKMATDGMDDLNLSGKDGWEKLYRKFIGILPGEENQQGYGCINGINVFNYFKPWHVFDLDPQTATSQDIKNAYHRLSKIYHPDVPETGDAAMFNSITVMYKSISAEA